MKVASKFKGCKGQIDVVNQQATIIKGRRCYKWYATITRGLQALQLVGNNYKKLIGVAYNKQQL